MTQKSHVLLWIVLTLLTHSLTSKCIKRKELTSQQQPYFAKMNGMYQDSVQSYSIHFLSGLDDGKLFEHPDDLNRVVRIYYYTKATNPMFFNEYKNLKLYSDKQDETDFPLKFAQKAFSELCVIDGDNLIYIIEVERFRDTINDGLTSDASLRVHLRDFSNRLKFYMKLMFAFSNLAELGVKHCAMTPLRILYRQKGEDFNRIQHGRSDQPFEFAISGMKYLTPLNKPCPLKSVEYTDHFEAQHKIYKSEKCKQKVEMFTLGMIILYFETMVYTMFYDLIVENRPKVLNTMFAGLPNGPLDLTKMFGVSKPLVNNTLIDMFLSIRSSIVLWNSGQEVPGLPDFGYSSIGRDMKYLWTGNALAYSYGQALIFPELNESDYAETKTKVDNVYEKFYKLVLTMCGKNLDKTPRPDQMTSLYSFKKIQMGYNNAIDVFYRRRQLRLI